MPLGSDCILDMEEDPPWQQDLDFSSKADGMAHEFGSDMDTMFRSEIKFDTELFDSLMNVDSSPDVEDWPNDVFSGFSDLPPSPEGIKLELNDSTEEITSPSSSPTSMVGSDSSLSSLDSRFNLETPPISPPDPMVVTSVPTLLHNGTKARRNPVLKINPKNVQIISVSAGFKPIGKSTQVVLPKNVVDKVIQLKNDNDSDIQSVPSVHCNGTAAKRRRELAARPEVSIPALKPVSQPSVTLAQPSVTMAQPSVTLSKMALSGPPSISLLQPTLMPAPSLSSQTPRSDISLKAFKKQQRMIKNRESAYLSRKKKKEYVQNLETKVNCLEKENKKLSMENEMLKCRVKELESLSFSNPLKSPLSSSLKKSVAFLAVVFMVSVNVGSIGFLPREGAVAGRFNSEFSPRRVGRALLWDESSSDNVSSSQPVCPLHVNQTESLRLDKELRQWIDDERGRTSRTYRNDSWRKPAPKKPSLRHFVLHSPPAPQRKKNEVKSSGEVDVWRFPPSLLRQGDMFYYVVSLSKEHLLFPAKQTNSTLRPRMSLVLPTAPLNESLAMNGSVPMMQIDCEVLATRSLTLTEQDIKLLQPNTAPPQQGRHNSTSGGYRDPGYKPYFLKTAKSRPDFDPNFDSFVSSKDYRAPNMFT